MPAWHARPWVPADLESAIAAEADRYAALDAGSEVHRLPDDHARPMDQECLSLSAGAEIMNPRAMRLLASSVGSRPSLGYLRARFQELRYVRA